MSVGIVFFDDYYVQSLSVVCKIFAYCKATAGVLHVVGDYCTCTKFSCVFCFVSGIT